MIVPHPTSGSWAVVSGGDHTVAIDTVGALYTCGSNTYGQLGVSSAT